MAIDETMDIIIFIAKGNRKYMYMYVYSVLCICIHVHSVRNTPVHETYVLHDEAILGEHLCYVIL